MQSKLTVYTKIAPKQLVIACRKPITVYTDASFKNRKIGIGIYWESKFDHPLPPPFSGLVSNPRCRDNNYGELFAILFALHNSPMDSPLFLRTDSLCSLQMIDNRLHNYKRIMNKYAPIVDDILDVATRDRNQNTWMSHVKGHAGCRGNVIADRLARLAIAAVGQPATARNSKPNKHPP